MDPRMRRGLISRHSATQSHTAIPLRSFSTCSPMLTQPPSILLPPLNMTERTEKKLRKRLPRRRPKEATMSSMKMTMMKTMTNRRSHHNRRYSG